MPRQRCPAFGWTQEAGIKETKAADTAGEVECGWQREIPGQDRLGVSKNSSAVAEN